MSVISAEYYECRQDRSDRRYLRAVKALARCRKLETATIQQTVERRLKVVG